MYEWAWHFCVQKIILLLKFLALTNFSQPFPTWVGNTKTWSHTASHCWFSNDLQACMWCCSCLKLQDSSLHLLIGFGAEGRALFFFFFLGIFVTNFSIYRSNSYLKIRSHFSCKNRHQFFPFLIWFLCGSKCCGREGDNGWFYKWGGVNFSGVRSGRKVTSAQKPPCPLAGGCGLEIHCGTKKESN